MLIKGLLTRGFNISEGIKCSRGVYMLKRGFKCLLRVY